MKRELHYIKANGKYHYPIQSKEQDPYKFEGCYLPVCFVKKLLFGRWKISYYDIHKDPGPYGFNQNQVPNIILIIYSAGIEEIMYKTNKP